MRNLSYITWVIPDQLAISDHSWALRTDERDRAGIRSVLCVSAQADYPAAGSGALLIAERCPIQDNSNEQPPFDLAVARAFDLHENCRPLLIHCREGGNRCIAIAATLVCLLNPDRKLDQVITEIESSRPSTHMDRDLLRNIRARLT